MTSTMSSAPSAPIVDQFLEFTGSTDRRAAEYLLELGGQDLEAAVSLYLSGERYKPPSAPQLQARKASRDRGAGEGGGDEGEYNEAMRFIAESGMLASGDLPPEYLEHLEHLHHAHSQVQRAGSSSGRRKDLYDENGVREADGVKRQRLLNDAPGGINRGVEGWRHDSSIAPLTNVFGVRETAQQHQEPPHATSKATSLRGMFASPAYSMSCSFDDAREECKPNSSRNFSNTDYKWMLVNIQRNDEFECHELNRDVWSNDAMRDVVGHSFLLWQQTLPGEPPTTRSGGISSISMAITQQTETEASVFVKRYNVTKYPYIGIIDPRTGEEVWCWSKHYRKGKAGETVQKIELDSLMEALMVFTGSKPFPGGSGSDVDGASSSSSTSSGGFSSLAPPTTTTVAHSSAVTHTKALRAEEEEELEFQRALALSTQEAQQQHAPSALGGVGDSSSVNGKNEYGDGIGASASNALAPLPNKAAGAAEEGVSQQEKEGFCVSCADEDTPATATAGAKHASAAAAAAAAPLQFKVEMPAPALTIKLQLPANSSISDLVREVAKRLQQAQFSSNTRFEVTFGHPMLRLQEVVKNLAATGAGAGAGAGMDAPLTLVGIRSGERLRVEKL